MKKKTDCKASPSAGCIKKTPSRVASRVNETPTGNSCVASYLISQTKHSSGISPASSISEWSTESSSNSTLEQRSNSSRASLHSISSKRISIDSDTSHEGRNHSVGPHTQTTGLLSQSVKKTSSQSSVLPPASMKPSGLRLPSPKIGFFDGVRFVFSLYDPVFLMFIFFKILGLKHLKNSVFVTVFHRGKHLA